MNQDQTDFVEFIQWMCEQTDIPLETRRDFVAHIRDNKGLDAKSADFIEQYVQKRKAQIQRSEEFMAQADQTIEQLAATERNPDTSLKKRVVDEGIADMEQLAEHFKANVLARDAELTNIAETAETQDSQAEVAALKAQL